MTEPSKSFRQIPAWQKAMDLSVFVYHQIGELNETERDKSLVEELMQSCMKIATSIAVGWDEDDPLYFRKHLRRSRGAVFRLCTVAELCERLELGGDWNKVIVDANEIRDELEQMIASLKNE